MPEIGIRIRLVGWRDYCAAVFIGFVLAVCAYAAW